ncbi:hypothetical protein ACFU99_08130 [Streptomyces sp. NPDC057654]|uniref:hypothetical protein n=1 Tax=Streptomyces sp. NPDC057654 TaxID=3346196 RepID=UPI0036A55A3C
MPAPVSRAQDMAARLSAASYEPRVTRHPDHFRIESDASGPIPLFRWRALLTALEMADSFGLDGDADGQTAWVTVRTEQTAGGGDGVEPTESR